MRSGPRRASARPPVSATALAITPAPSCPRRQARTPGAAGPGWALLDRVVRALPALRTGARGDARRNVRAGRLDKEGQGDHGGVVRPLLLGLGPFGHQQALGREPRRLCPAPAYRAFSLPHPRCPL